MINRTVLTGRLTDDIQVNYTNGQKPMAVSNFRLAVNRRFKDANGQRPADFISCVIWGKGAETLSQYAGKGSMIGVDGRIQTRNYDNQQGQKVYVTEIVVENFTLLGGNNGNQQQGNGNQPSNYQNGNYGNNNPNSFDPFQSNNNPTVSDSDLPF